MIDPNLYKGSDYYLETVPIELRDTVTGAATPGTGLAITAFVSATKTHASTAITPELSVSLNEIGAEGAYCIGLQGADITAAYPDTERETPAYLHLVCEGIFHLVYDVTVHDVREGE